MDKQVDLISPGSFYDWLESVRERFYESENLKNTLDSIRKQISAKATTETVEGDLAFKEAKIFSGSLIVRGNVTLPGEQELLIVAGDFTVDGDLIALGSDYSLVFVGGNLRCKNIFTNGELVVLGSIYSSNIVLGVGNDHSAVACELNANYLFLTDDRGDFFDKINSSQIVEESNLSTDGKKQISTLLGDSPGLNAIIDFFVDRGSTWPT